MSIFRILVGTLVACGFAMSIAAPSYADAPLEGTKPAHWRVTWTLEPATSATISWSTAKAAKKYSLSYRVKGTGEVESTIAPETGRFMGGSAELYFYHARLTDLKPATEYEFRINCDGEESPTLYFATATSEDRPFSILQGGDSRSDQAERRRVNQMIASMVSNSFANEAPGDDIVALVHGGDYVAKGTSLDQWTQWLSDHESTIGKDGRVLPVIPARGNHDTGELFNQVFGFPQKDTNYYALNIGRFVRLVTLNSETSTAGDQASWLNRELKSARPKNRWLLSQYHRPAFPAVKAPGAALQSWVPLFEKYNIDLVFEADGHNIKRTVPIRGNVKDETGVIYIGEGGLGVQQRTPKVERWYLQSPGMTDSASHVFVITFERDSLTGKCVRLDGSVADRFQLKPRKNETVQAFVVTGDPQYLAEDSPDPKQLDPFSEEANSRFVQLLKGLPRKGIPQRMGGGSVPRSLNGVIVAGDLVDSGDKTGDNHAAMQRFEWNRYKADYGLTGRDGGLPFPVYELHGNHDGPQGDTFIIKDIIARNKKRKGPLNISPNGLHYSWNWGPLHLVNLGMFVGKGQQRRDQFHYAPLGSLEFLVDDLESQVGDSGRPVVLAFHLHPNGPAFDWPPQDLKLFWDTIEQYNVVALFHGHTHGSPPSRIKWNDEEFGPALENGIDVFNPDDAGAAKSNPQSAGNPIGLRHGFLYVELIDRIGTLEDEFVVRSMTTDDNWKTHAWGKEWRKRIEIPSK